MELANIEIIDGELRSFMRNAFERILKVVVPGRQMGPWANVMVLLSYRMIGSLLAVFLFDKVKRVPHLNKVVTVIFVLIFAVNLYWAYQEAQESQ